MKILSAIKTGFSRSLNVWKGILVYWFTSLLLVSFVVVPLRSSLKSSLGQSMITEKLVRGINIDVLGDLGKNLQSMSSSLFSGIFLLFLTGVILNIFISGGIFDNIRGVSRKSDLGVFFRASAKNFWSFTAINLVLSMLVIFLALIIIVIPVAIKVNTGMTSEGTLFRTLKVSALFFLLVVVVLSLVADIARAWQVAFGRNNGFGAIAIGINRTFRTLPYSFILMIILRFLQVLPVCCLFALIAWYTPVTGGGVFFLSVISQSFFLLKIFLKVVRYASVTAYMELIKQV